MAETDPDMLNRYSMTFLRRPDKDIILHPGLVCQILCSHQSQSPKIEIAYEKPLAHVVAELLWGDLSRLGNTLDLEAMLVCSSTENGGRKCWMTERMEASDHVCQHGRVEMTDMGS